MRRIFTQKKKSREMIEKEAFAAMRKAKAAIDPGVLAKVKAAIEKSGVADPFLGGKKKDKEPELSKKEKAALAAKKAHGQVQEKEVVVKQESKKEVEQVDQAKMLDIVAKTLELNPHKSGLKKGVKDILSDN